MNAPTSQNKRSNSRGTQISGDDLFIGLCGILGVGLSFSYHLGSCFFFFISYILENHDTSREGNYVKLFLPSLSEGV